MNHEVNEIASALELAAKATRLLEDQGVSVIAAMANGRRPLLYVTRIPRELGAVVKRSYGNGLCGRTVVRAAQFEGCQLESMTDEPNPPQARRLQAVANG